jgi:hypothetical protein
MQDDRKLAADSTHGRDPRSARSPVARSSRTRKSFTGARFLSKTSPRGEVLAGKVDSYGGGLAPIL